MTSRPSTWQGSSCGRATPGRGAIGLRRWLVRLRVAFPRASGSGWTAASPAPSSSRFSRPGGRIRRGHAQQCAPRQARPSPAGTRPDAVRTTGHSTPLFGETRYAAKNWHRKRRVIMKAEVVRHPGRAPANNPRFVVTNLPPRPRRSTRSTASGATWRTGSRSCITVWPGPDQLPGSWPISSASC